MPRAQDSTDTTQLPQPLWQRIPQVWVRFLVALLGLIFAFGAAIFSTVTRESGNVWGTVAFASLALVLATVVGLTTVPYLARRVATARLRNAFDYDVTRAGIVYVAIVVLIGIAALNTGNNLLYIVVAALLGAILVSGIVSALVLRDLQLDVRLPQHVFAGRTAHGRLVLHNLRRWAPSFSVSVVALKKDKTAQTWNWSATTFGFPPGRPPQEQWIKLPDRKLSRVKVSAASTEIFRGAAYFPYIPPRGEVKTELELKFSARGVYRQDGFGLMTRFPFAFLAKTRQVPLAREIVVYPSVEPANRFFEILPLIAGELESFMRGRGSDLYRIREYTQEDSARHVDWKATAKSGSLKVREFSREDQRKLRIIFDNPAPGDVPTAAYEDAVKLAASLAWHFSGESTEVSFTAPDQIDSSDIYGFLRYLAEVKPQRTASVLDNLRPTDEYNLIFTARPRSSIPTALLGSSYFVFLQNDAAAR